MTPREKAARAGGLLRDPVLTEALTRIRDGARTTIENSQPPDVEQREAAYHELRAVSLVTDTLQDFVDDYAILNKEPQPE